MQIFKLSGGIKLYLNGNTLITTVSANNGNVLAYKVQEFTTSAEATSATMAKLLVDGSTFNSVQHSKC